MLREILKRLVQIWGGLSLAWQFVIAGGIVLLAVMLVVGLWVTSQIRQGGVGVFFDWSPESSTYRHHVKLVLPPLARDAT